MRGNREAEVVVAKFGLVCSSFLIARLGSIKPLFAFWVLIVSKYAVSSAMVQGLRLHPWKARPFVQNLPHEEVLQQHVVLLL